MKTLQQIPIPVAVGIMILLILVGVALGNNNALSDAKEAPEAKFEEVSAMATKRAVQAQNLVTVAKRSDVEEKSMSALEDTIEGVKSAKNASRLFTANQELTAVAATVNDRLQEVADAHDRKLATGVIDEMTSLDKQLARVASSYNVAVEEVRKVYNTLPMRWIIGGMPEVYA